MKKNVLSIITVSALCLSLLPTAALAEGEDGLYDADVPTPPLADLWVGGVQVTADNSHDVLGDGTVSYSADDNTLVLNGADITAGYTDGEGHAAGIYTEGDLNIEVVGADNKITAPAGVMSHGICVDALSISGTGTLTVSGGPAAATDDSAESVGIYTTGDISIYQVTVVAEGSSAVVTGDGKAYSNGVYTEGSLMVDFGGKLTASGGEATGENAFSTGMDAYGTEDNYLNIAIYDDSYAVFTGGNAVGEEYAGSCGIYGTWAGLYVYGSDAYVTLRGGAAESTGTSEDAYAYSNGVMIHAGDVGIDGGTVAISSGPWSGLYGDGYALYVVKEECEDENGQTYSLGGSVNIDCEEITLSPDNPSLMGTRVTITAEKSSAVYAEMGVTVGDKLTISAPEGAEIKGIGGSDDPENWVEPDYWTVVNAEGAEVESISIEPLRNNANHWAKDAVDFVTARGIFDGTTANTSTPDGSMPRQAMWMVLARMSGEEPADMDEAKVWAVENGISDGSNPTLTASRQQFVTMLWRWAQSQDIDVSVGEDTNILSYEDAFDISEYAIPAFQWACGAGVVSGYADHTLKPEATASRAHVATMLMNFLNK